MRKLLVVSAAVACLMTAQAPAATVACFAPADAKEAHLRQMQQEFTVAALSCGSAQPAHETMADRYNAFVGKFANVLRDNAHALLAHFSHNGGASGFDNWMTKLANAASVQAATDPDYCQRAWGSLDLAMAIEPKAIAEFATTNTVANELVPICHERHAQKKADAVGLVEPEQVVAGE
jgi:hypothetical protein